MIKKTKNAFTLIELLAIIVLLGIIGLIAIPTINDVINESKLNMSMNGGENYVKAVNNELSVLKMDNDTLINGNYTIKDGNLYLEDDKIKVEATGKFPENNGEVLIKNNKVVKACMTIDNQDITYNGEKIIGKNCKYALNLIKNGYLENKNNDNFYAFTYKDGYLTYTGGEFALLSDEISKIDPKKSYNYSIIAKSNITNSRTYIGIAEYDIDKNNINPSNVTYIDNTTTKLTRDLNNGDTVVYLDDVENFKSTDWVSQNGFIFWNYVDSTGYKYPKETYSRNVFSDLYTTENIDKENNTITLKLPWNNGSISSGTSLSQSSTSGSYNYSLLNYRFLEKNDVKYEANISGINHSGELNNNKFRAGTKYIKLILLHNYFSSDSATTYIKDIVFEEVY